MGITHHSNYIRWMEEARVDYMDRIGWSYARLEEEGILSPVVSLQCRFRKPTTFDDAVDIEVFVKEFSGNALVIGYEMTLNGERVFTGESQHCFMDRDGRFIRLRRELPGFYDMLKGALAETESASDEESSLQEGSERRDHAGEEQQSSRG